MLKRMSVLGWLVLALVATQAMGAEPASDAAQKAMAERFAELGRGVLQTRVILPQTWRQSSALLRVASELDPREERYARLLVEATLQSRDSDAAIDALKAYRALCPDDQHAQIQLIDLYSTRLETADRRIEYLRRLAGESEQIPPEVRSHVATVCAGLLLDQSRATEAIKLLDEALALNPLNAAALRAKYALVQRSGTAEERVHLLLAILRVNPSQLPYLSALAGELAAAGLVEPSLSWYSTMLGIARQTGDTVSMEAGVEYLAELIIGNHLQSAAEFARMMLQSGQDNPEVALMAAVLAQNAGEKDAATIRQLVGNLLFNRLAAARRAAGDTTATTRPADSTAALDVPDLSPEVQRLKEAGRDDLLAELINATSDLAWYQLYFSGQPRSAARAIEALRQVLPADSVLLARLDGWTHLLEGRSAEAKVKLSAVEQRDALSRLGMLKLQEKAAPEDRQKLSADAAALLGAHPAGLLGAILADAVRPWGVKVEPGTQAAAIQKLLEAFPANWVKILSDPGAFYSLRAESVDSKVAHGFAEPMLIRITLTNVGDLDLAMGDQGVLRPDLWFDARLRGLADDQLPAIAFDRLSKRLVLRRRESVSQVVRLDQGRLAQALAAHPQASLQVAATVISNPTMRGGYSVPGPAGLRTGLALLQRSGTPGALPSQRQKIMAMLGSGPGAEKIRLLDFCGRFAEALNGEQATDEMRALAREYAEAIRRTTSDASPLVSSWAKFTLVRLAAPKERQEVLAELLRGGAREARLLGLVGMGSLPAEQQKTMVSALLASEQDPLVRENGQAVQEFLALVAAATTAPTTAPTTLPTTGPSGG